MQNSVTAYVGLGSNLGDRQKNINDAIKMLTETEGIELLRTSDIIETKPLAEPAQPNYLNNVVEIKTDLSAQVLHEKTLAIEAALGRTRNLKWSPRTIDLDILFFGDQIINQPNLTIPHHQMHLRTFVLKGLSQLNPQLRHPVLNVSVTELLARLNDSDFLPDPGRAKLISIAGIIGVGKTTLANKLAELLNCTLLLEPYDKNPFMPDVYAGKTDFALDSQLFFLTHRIKQLNSDALQKQKTYVTDYIFDKELIYANRQLNKIQLELYNGIYSSLTSKVTTPMLVIYLTDTPENCLERIHKRNRPYEQEIQLTFLDALYNDYQRLFGEWKTSPVIKIKASKLDYDNNSYFEHLTNQINCYTGVQAAPQPIDSVKA